MRLVALAAPAVVAATLAACSSPVTPTEPSPPSPTGSSTPDPSLTAVDLPPATPGAHTLLEVPARTGTFEKKKLAAGAGELRVLATCSGEGNLEVHYRPDRSITFQCTSHQALTWNGPETLPSAEDLDIRVTAAPSITWSLRLEQG